MDKRSFLVITDFIEMYFHW